MSESSKIRKPILTLAASTCFALAACAGPSAAGGDRLTFPSTSEAVGIEGTLVEARCYFNTGAVGGNHAFCAFSSARANLPLGVLTANNEFIFLTASPSRLAAHVTKPVRVQGLLTPNRQLIRPIGVQIAGNGTWIGAEL